MKGVFIPEKVLIFNTSPTKKIIIALISSGYDEKDIISFLNISKSRYKHILKEMRQGGELNLCTQEKNNSLKISYLEFKDLFLNDAEKLLIFQKYYDYNLIINNLDNFINENTLFQNKSACYTDICRHFFYYLKKINHYESRYYNKKKRTTISDIERIADGILKSN